jgi:Mg2+ and Co2+ transporter CorA
MNLYLLGGERFEALAEAPETPPPAQAFLWLSVSRAGFKDSVAQIQSLLQAWGEMPLVDLHVSDLLNKQLPSHFDYTSWYDLLVFRRLVAVPDIASEPHVPGALPRIDTSPVGFAIFDRVLLTVHPEDCQVRDHFVQRLQQMAQGGEARGSGSRLPTSASDLMLRMVNHIVDSYLDLRRLLSRQLAELQQELLAAKRRRSIQWEVVLDARNTLHMLEDVCEDQRAAMQEWIDGLEEWPAAKDAPAARERELLTVRARDVLEHIERVLSHVRRLESSAETAVQMHFSALGQRTNDIMRTLTVLTAIFLPLNLITGIFGMNVENLPLIHRALGFWIIVGIMAAVGLGFLIFFWRKKYLGSHDH